MLNIFNTAEAEGRLREGATVVAASSGNTGCSVAMLCAIRGYRAVVITNEKCSKEKCDAITAYGAELLIVPPGECYMQKEHDLASEHPDWFSVDQYENRQNPAAHYKSVGPEIWRQTAGDVTHFVAAGSTGGTITGTGAYRPRRPRLVTSNSRRRRGRDADMPWTGVAAPPRLRRGRSAASGAGTRDTRP